MNRQIITPTTKQDWLNLRVQDITSTEVSALFGISPYTTQFELWHQKKNAEVVVVDPNERMTWGTRLQDSIAYGIAEDEGWNVRRMDEYIRIPELRVGASFDFSVEGDSPGLLEIKNVDSLAFKKGWIVEDDGSVEAPPHIELQVQHQMLVSGRGLATIGALVGGNTVKLMRREPDKRIVEEMLRRVAKFWASIEENKPPAPDFARDAEAIARIYNYAEPGKVIDARGDETYNDLMEKYKKAGIDEKAAESVKESIKGQIIMLIGDAEKVMGDWGSISAGVIGPCHVEYDRKGYRSFKPYFKK